MYVCMCVHVFSFNTYRKVKGKKGKEGKSSDPWMLMYVVFNVCVCMYVHVCMYVCVSIHVMYVFMCILI